VALEDTALSREISQLCDVRVVHSGGATDLYITCAGPEGAAVDEARRGYEQIAALLKSHHAWIFQERLFTAPGLIEHVLAARSAAYGVIDDGVRPTILAVEAPITPFVGIQVHAVAGVGRPRTMELTEAAVGRCFEHGGCQWLSASGLAGATTAAATVQARQAFEKADALLGAAGTDFSSVARTWIWMDDIVAWYDEFNPVRTQFFRERGLIGREGLLPASTGIGVSPAGGRRCAIDLFAVWGKPEAIVRHHAAGKQRSAYEYGSAFARAATALTPAGKLVFCSGTAAIDHTGATCHVGDARRQTSMTIDNVVSVLSELDCGGRDVVQAIAYCKTPEVYAEFVSRWQGELNWPCLVMPGDICRDNLLFELEAAAAPRARRI